ncbi:hypothetical protein EI94DRAFT_1697618 [Lactarius quietus]|nr:hypothetical protein EI94DRAFT_1697618 [Lactarius quietus]
MARRLPKKIPYQVRLPMKTIPSEAADETTHLLMKMPRPVRLPMEGAGGRLDEEKKLWVMKDEQVAVCRDDLANSELLTGDRSIIIQDSVAQIERTWTHDVDFNREIVKKEIDKLAAKCPVLRQGRQPTLAVTKEPSRQSMTNWMKKLRVKYQAEAKKWMEHKPPPQQQQRLMEKYGQSSFGFSVTMYNQFGVQVVVLAGYCDGDGEPTVMLVQPRNGGQDNGKNKENPKNIKLPTNRHGYPVLPSWEAINQEGATYKKLLIGKFMTQLYSGGKGRIPWARLSEAPDDFILPKYLPNGITLTQYHHIRVEDTMLSSSTGLRGKLPGRSRSGSKCRTKGPIRRDSTGFPGEPGMSWVTEHPKEVVRDRLSRCLADRVEETLPGTQAKRSLPSTSVFPLYQHKRPAKAAEARKDLRQRKMGG